MSSNRNENCQSKKKLAYTIAAGAAMASASSTEAFAEIYYSGVRDQVIVLEADQRFLNLDYYQGDTTDDIALQNYIFTQGNYQGIYVVTAPGKLVSFKLTPTGIAYTKLLSQGDLIDSTTVGPSFIGSLAYGTINPNAQFNNVTSGYIGLSFVIGGLTVNHLHYGWLRVDINNAAGTYVVRDWAYESVQGVGILAGDTGVSTLAGDFDEDGDVDGRDFLIWQRGGSPNSLSPVDLSDWQTNYGMTPPVAATTSVPEPSTLGFLAAGSVGIGLLRRLRGR